jgi:CTP-dependent riboflavin kinase
MVEWQRGIADKRKREGRSYDHTMGRTHQLARVSPEEAQKALEWLHEKKVIDYQVDQGGRGVKISFEGIYSE